METITFTSFQVVVDGKFPTVDDYDVLCSKALIKYDREGVHYKIEHKLANDNDFYWMYASYGNPLPYSDQVYDTLSQVTKDNPRKQYDAELRNQFFALYDFKTQSLYLSNSQKKVFFEVYCKTYIGKEVIIKRIYKSAEDFLSIVKKVSNLRLVSQRSIFTMKSGLFDDVDNVFGLGEPEQIELDLSFGKIDKTNIFEQMLKGWRNRFQECQIDKLICVGYDENDMEVVFNTESFMHKIEVKQKKNSKGMFEQISVRDALLAQVRVTADV